jgi:hypothetical protein
MGKRLNQERQEKLERERVEHALKKITQAGYNPKPVYFTTRDGVQHLRAIEFLYKGNVISFYPYSGWAAGKGIKDGRGLQNLLKQINTEPFTS